MKKIFLSVLLLAAALPVQAATAPKPSIAKLQH
jgi:hypothetical protein